jgi:hypothetical protein
MLCSTPILVVTVAPNGANESTVKRALSIPGFPVYFETGRALTEQEKHQCEQSLKAGLDFEVTYATRSGVTVNQLRDLGRATIPCACGESECGGWKSTNAKDLN